MMEVECWTATELLAKLRDSRRVQIDGWAINLDGGVIWLTNPYGLDCAFFSESEQGCESILVQIRTDTHEREWGTL